MLHEGSASVWVCLLLRFEVSVNDAEAVEVVQSQSELCQVELHVFLCEHHLHQTQTFIRPYFIKPEDGFVVFVWRESDKCGEICPNF